MAARLARNLNRDRRQPVPGGSIARELNELNELNIAEAGAVLISPAEA